MSMQSYISIDTSIDYLSLWKLSSLLGDSNTFRSILEMNECKSFLNVHWKWAEKFTHCWSVVKTIRIAPVICSKSEYRSILRGRICILSDLVTLRIRTQIHDIVEFCGVRWAFAKAKEVMKKKTIVFSGMVI